MMHVPEEYRRSVFGEGAEIGNNGAFVIPTRLIGPPGSKSFASRPEFFRAIAGNGEGWEHVSVSLPNRCPTWEEMCAIKDLFWDAEDCVVQYHPPKSEYVNCHLYCLHLWRPIGFDLARPHHSLVGPK